MLEDYTKDAELHDLRHSVNGLTVALAASITVNAVLLAVVFCLAMVLSGAR